MKKLGRIPDYLRTTTNKYKGDVTEKVALNWLKNNGFVYQRFFRVNQELERGSQELVDHLNIFKQIQKKYEFKSPPEGFRIEGTETWEEYRKKQLEYTQWHTENVEKAIKGRKELETSLRKKWGSHLNGLVEYCKWLDKQQGNPRYPDFIVEKDGKVCVVEVKSKSEKGTAFFSKHQRKALLKACDFGLVPLLLIIPIEVDIEIGEPQLKSDKEEFC